MLDLYLQGKTMDVIAENLGIHHQTVHKDIRWVMDEYKEKSKEKADELIAYELAQLSRVESEAWAQWEESKKDKEVKVRRSTVATDKLSDGTLYEKELRHLEERAQNQCGDPSYLNIIIRVHEKRSEMLGLREHLAAPGVEQFIQNIGDSLRAMAQLEEGVDIEPGYGGEYALPSEPTTH